jgi:hypothetical protein
VGGQQNVCMYIREVSGDVTVLNVWYSGKTLVVSERIELKTVTSE